MQSDFTLTIATQPATWHAEFRLCDHVGNQLAYQHTDFTTLTVGEQQRLFYLRDFLDSNVDADNEAAEVEQLGICIADKVLGADIMLRLWQAGPSKTLRIVLPGAGQPDLLENHQVSREYIFMQRWR